MCVCPPALTAQRGHRLHTGTAVEVTGEWKPSPAGKEQSYELKAQIVRIVGSVDAEVGRRGKSGQLLWILDES